MSELEFNVPGNKEIGFELETQYVVDGIKASINGVKLEGDLTSQDLFIPTLEDVASIQNDVDTLEGNVDSLSSQITTLTNTTTQHTQSIQTNTNDIANIKNNVTSIQEDVTSAQGEIDTITANVDSLTTQVTTNIANINVLSITKADKTYVDTQLASEVTNRENADNDLQSQIDAITSSSDVVDIVGTYAELQAYDTSSLGNNDIVKVLNDSTHDNAQSYFRWNKTTQTWSYIGSEGVFYTKSESDERFVPQTRTVNGKALSSNVTLNASDVNALPSSTVIPSKTSDLTNDSGYATETYVDNSVTINKIQVNGEDETITNKTVNLLIPGAFIYANSASGIGSAEIVESLSSEGASENVCTIVYDNTVKTVALAFADSSSGLEDGVNATIPSTQWVQDYIASLNATNVRY